jgi:hypothetical protein
MSLHVQRTPQPSSLGTQKALVKSFKVFLAHEPFIDAELLVQLFLLFCPPFLRCLNLPQIEKRDYGYIKTVMSNGMIPF